MASGRDAEKSSRFSPENRLPDSGRSKRKMLPHILFTPRAYEEGGQRWPLLLFLHGAGERGNDLNLLRKYGPPKIVQGDPDFPFVLVAPQCPSGTYWRPAPLLQLLDEMIAKMRIDPRRVYATGVSMGGYGTWQLAAEAPERLAAIAPICGGGDPQTARYIKEIPIWAFHGDKDDIVPLSETVMMVEAVLRAGGNPKLTVYPGVGHDSWTPAYAEPDLVPWLLSHQKPAP